MNFLAEMGSKFRFSTVELDAIFKRNYMRRYTLYNVYCTLYNVQCTYIKVDKDHKISLIANCRDFFNALCILKYVFCEINFEPKN